MILLVKQKIVNVVFASTPNLRRRPRSAKHHSIPFKAVINWSLVPLAAKGLGVLRTFGNTGNPKGYKSPASGEGGEDGPEVHASQVERGTCS